MGNNFTSDAINNKKFKTFADFKNSLILACLQSIAQTKNKILPYINEFKIAAYLSQKVPSPMESI